MNSRTYIFRIKDKALNNQAIKKWQLLREREKERT
jgi:hypothetical protein